MERYMRNSNEPMLIDRVISVLTYLTMGFIGFIWIIISVLNKKNIKPFIKFNIFQSILISLILVVFNLAMTLFLQIVGIIPFVGQAFLNIYYYLFNFPIIFTLSLFNIAFISLLIYLIFNSFMGKYPEIPVISDNIRRMI